MLKIILIIFTILLSPYFKDWERKNPGIFWSLVLIIGFQFSSLSNINSHYNPASSEKNIQSVLAIDRGGKGQSPEDALAAAFAIGQPIPKWVTSPRKGLVFAPPGSTGGVTPTDSAKRTVTDPDSNPRFAAPGSPSELRLRKDPFDENLTPEEKEWIVSSKHWDDIQKETSSTEEEEKLKKKYYSEEG